MNSSSQESIIPLLAVLCSLAAVPAILLSGRSPNLREAWTFVAAFLKFACVLALVPTALDGGSTVCNLIQFAPGLHLRFVVDPAGVFFALVASGLWIVTSAYAIGYMRGHHEKKQTRFYASFAMSLSSTLGVAFAGDLLTFLVFYEMLTLATYPLVVHSESPAALRSARMYLSYALTAGLLLLAGTVWIYLRNGSVDFAPGGGLVGDAFSATEAKWLFLCLMVGVGVKSGIMPLHSWLPNAMVAPTPVSALLHAVAVVKSGAFGVLRITGFVFGPETLREHGLDLVLAIMTGATVLLASLIALRQDNLKKRLAYSTVAHLSYIGLGAALLTMAGFQGAFLHLAAHATMKITLFFCAGAIAVHTHRTQISQLDGLGRKMPWTFGAFTIGSLGLAGIPPINGFISKWWLAIGSLDSSHRWALAVFLLSGLLNAAYFFPIILRAFFRPAKESAHDHGHGDGHDDHADHEPDGEASPWMVVPLCLTASLALIFGIFPNFPLPFFQMAAGIAESIMHGVTASLPTP
jgi:multicomponent Na+:H+ antiporter subunit D